MGRSFGSRTFLTICGALVVLLAALAAVQYGWATRVASADIQREKEHLDSSASLFASQFNGIAGEAIAFLQNDAWASLKSGARLASVPKVIDELYYLDFSAQGQIKGRRLTPEGLFTPTSLPPWITIPRCAMVAIEQPASLVAPIYDMATTESQGAAGTRILKTFRSRSDRCFVARIDQNYLHGSLMPELIRQSFGDTSAREYDFAVVSVNPPHDTYYGVPIRADLRKKFFSIPNPLLDSKALFTSAPGAGQSTVFVQRFETGSGKGEASVADLYGPGIWELDVAHKGAPLAAAFEHTRQRDLLLSVAVESLLVAAIVFLALGVRRMQQLADQKMRFVAGVSHELRTPVSAIAMLSRNQADGLVAGAERVKQYGELIHQQTRRLNEMVEQALQYAGIQSGLRSAAKDEVDLRHLIQEVVDARREDLARDGFEIEIAASKDLPRVSGDVTLLRTAFDNLLNNAQKHARAGRWIRVSAHYIATDKEIRISVEDRGDGIDPLDQTDVFQPFCRGRAAVAAQIPGSGIGLSLVRSAAEAHRGSVTLVSKPGHGSTFTMHLPV
jgi:two-component system, OmpR family, sensor histidine kinase SenX3